MITKQYFKHWYYYIVAISIAILTPTIANAHVGNGDNSGGLLHGIIHPLTGVDHTLAMITVGIIAIMLGGKNVLVLPTVFVSSMVIGSIIGTSQVLIPNAELMIVMGNFVLASILLFNLRLKSVLMYIGISFFALFHGYAHGMEMPATVNGFSYGLGFVASTIALHVIGITAGKIIDKYQSTLSVKLYQLSGALALFTSLFLLVLLPK